MNNQFTNKVALITGATSGIGRATAIAFANEGAKVTIAGRREEEGAQVVREIEQAGGEALFVRTDVAREADVEALVAKTVERFGRLDFAFNNAVSMAFPAAPSMAWDSIRLPPQSSTAIAIVTLRWVAHSVQASTMARAPSLEMTLMVRVACIADASAANDSASTAERASRLERMRMGDPPRGY